ncbi:muts domain V-domain-containing protein [Tuber brumale]|nr:muts domain V-domain-containing protein [Tuber brumale]
MPRPPTSSSGTSRPPTSTSRPRTSRPRTATCAAGGGAQQVICAVTESRGVSATIGLCFVNTTTGECVLSEICDTQTYVRTMQKLTVFDPTEILVSPAAVAPPKSTLLSIIEDYVPGAMITEVPRRYFSERSGHDYIQQLAFPDEVAGIKVAISGKFYAISAAAAALKHIEVSYIRFALHSLRIKYQGSEGSMLIDFSTVHSLELIQNIQDPKSTECLFGLLDNTLTAMGARLLRASILQPLTDFSTLNARLDAVEEFTQHEEMFSQARQALKPFLDMDRLLTALITMPVKPSLKHSEQAINNVIILKQSLSSIAPVYDSLSPARSWLLVSIRNLCESDQIEPVRNLISSIINEDVAFSKSPLDLRNQRCYAVKSGVNGLLDVARQVYKEVTEDVHQLVEDMSKEYDLPLELKYETGRGYYLRLPASEIEDKPLPPVFVNMVKRKKIVEFSALEMLKCNAKIGDSLAEVVLMSDNSVQKLVEDIRKEVPALYRVAEGIAVLDMILSFAQLCTIQDYVRPEFADTLALKAGRHPIRERIHKDRFVPNDVYASQQSRFQIITGCNMAGKSTYLRSIALTAIIAQIGSFVPAQYASFPITRRLFARVSMDDGIEANASTFASEMRETAFIHGNVEKGSLVIMDELGRGTSTRDGLALAVAVCEALIESRALVWFATHFKDLARILARRAGVVNLHLRVQMEDENTMTMLYKVTDGAVEDKNYGLTLARLVGLPQSVLDRAAAVSEVLVGRLERNKRKSEATNLARRRNLVLTLKETLIRARDGNMEEGALQPWLSRLQDEFVNRMAAWDAEDMHTRMTTTEGDEGLEKVDPEDKQMEGIIEIDSSEGEDDIDQADDRY